MILAGPVRANAFQAPTSMHGGVVARGIPGPGIARTGPASMDVGPNNDNDLLREYLNDNDQPMPSIPGPDIVRTGPTAQTEKEWLRKFADTAADAGLNHFIASARLSYNKEWLDGGFMGLQDVELKEKFV